MQLVKALDSYIFLYKSGIYTRYKEMEQELSSVSLSINLPEDDW